MRHVAAYLLAVLGGNESPSAADVKKIMASVGVDADETRLNKLIEELNGKDISEIIEQGSEKLAKFGGGGACAAAAGGAAGAEAAVEEAKKEESEEEEADLGGGMDMFGGGADY